MDDDFDMVPKLGEDVINQIKSFKHSYNTSHNSFDKLTQEQQSLINELISSEELRERYKKYGLCEECNQPNTGRSWCQSCNSKRFQQNFNKWTSGNKEIDEFIQIFQLNATCPQELLEWIPYDNFVNIEHLARGGFGTVYKADWIDNIQNWDQNKWKRNYDKSIVLKSLNNSQNLTIDILQEITFHKKLTNSSQIIKCYGISQDPKSNDYIMVMDYIKNGSINKFLKNNYNRLKLYEKLILIRNIANGLRDMHDKGFIHKNLHSGNILIHDPVKCYISDLGLCGPINEQTKDGEKKIYGVLPYVAPEALRDKTYTQAADIYSFGILTYEIISELPPHHSLSHDESLASKICQGLRPRFKNVKVPQLLEKLIDQCLDADLLARPTADELFGTFNNWINNFTNKETDFGKQYKEVKELLNKSKSNKSNKSSNTSPSSPSYTIHSQAIYHSRPLEYKNLPNPQNSKEIHNQVYNSLAVTEYPVSL